MLERIVSLEPSVSATLVALGQVHRLVGVTRYCSRLVTDGQLDGIHKVETTWSVKSEDVAALNPDLVVAGLPYQAGKVDSLLKARLNVLCLYPESLNDVYKHIQWLGRLCDASEKADGIVNDMKAAISDLSEQAVAKPKQRVFIEMWPSNPLMSGVSWIAEMVELLGGEVVPVAPHGRQVTQKEVIDADPEIIILAWAGMKTIDINKVVNREGWENVSAIRAGKVATVNEINVNAPGPNLADGAREVFDAMYG